MRKLSLLLVFLSVLLFPHLLYAQGSSRQGIVFSNAGRPVPGASIYVCTGSVTVSLTTTPPCTPAASIYSDVALTLPITQPDKSDANGNYLYYVPSGTYTEVISGPGIATYSAVITVNGGSGGGSLNPPVAANGIKYVTSDGNDANSGTFPDAAHAKQHLSAALAACPTLGCMVYDYNGSETWSANPFSSLAAGVSARVYLSRQTYITNVSVVVPNKSQLIGAGRGDAAAQGTVIQAGSSFPATGVPVVDLGASSPSFGVQVTDLTVECNNIAGVIGGRDQNAQEQSYFQNAVFHNCAGGNLVITGAQAQNSGPYRHLELYNDASCTSCSASSTPLVVGTSVAALRGVEDVTINASGATTPTYGATIDSGGRFSDIHDENVGTGIEIGSVGSVSGLSLNNIECGPISSSCVAVSSANTVQDYSFLDVTTTSGTAITDNQFSPAYSTGLATASCEIVGVGASKPRFQCDPALTNLLGSTVMLGGLNLNSNPLNGNNSSFGLLIDTSVETANRTVTGSDANTRLMPWDGVKFTPDLDFSFKGANPYYDIRAYGAVSGSIHTTGTGTGTALTVGVSSFANGEGIAVAGGGAASTMTNPASGPTVTPGEAEGETVSNVPMAAGAQGTTTYSYTFFAEAQNGSLTAASPAGSTTTGAATLGPQTITLNSLSLTGNTLTIGSASNTGLLQYAILHTKAASNSFYLSGYFPMNTIISGTSASASGLPGYSATAVTAASGTGVYFSGNTLTGLGVTGSLRTWICRGGVIVGVTLPGQATWTDFGFPAPPIPWYISNANCSAASSTPALAVTTVSAGGGTTSLTLSAPLTTAVTGAAVRLDSEPGILAAAQATSGTSAVYIPSGSFEVNSYLQVPDKRSFVENGTLVLNDTLATGTGFKWSGNLYSGNAVLQFSNSNDPQVTCNAYPCINFANASGTALGINFSHLFISGADNDLLMAAYGSVGGWGYSFDTVELFTGNDNNDDAGMGFYSTPNISQIRFVNSLLFAGPGQNYDQTWAPFIYEQGGGGGAAGIQLRDVQWSRRGLFFLENSGGPISIDSGGYSYIQGPITPLFAVENSGSGLVGGNISLHTVNIDSSPNPGLALWGVGAGTVGGSYRIEGTTGPSSDGGGNPNFVTGGGSSYLEQVAIDQMGYQNLGLSLQSGSLQATNGINAPNLQNALQSPVANTPTLSSGGSVSTGTLNLCVQALGPSSTTSACGNTVSVTVTSGNQTVTITWAAALGATGYKVWSPNGNNSANSGTLGNVTTYTFSTNLACCTTAPVIAYGPVLTQTNGFFANLGTPATIGLANATGLPFSTGLTGFPALCTGSQFSQGVSASSNNCATPSGSGTVTASPQYEIPDYSAAGTASTLTGLSWLTGYDGVPQTLTETTSAGSPTAPVAAVSGVVVNAQTGTTYTFTAADRNKWVTFSNAASVAVTLPQAGSAGFNAGYLVHACDIGAGTATITPTTSTISYTNGSAYTSGAASLALTTGQCATIVDDATGSNYTGSVYAGGGSSGLSGMTAGQVPIAATATTVTSSKAIQGTDTSLLSSGTISGTGATLCTDANGGATTAGCSSGGTQKFFKLNCGSNGFPSSDTVATSSAYVTTCTPESTITPAVGDTFYLQWTATVPTVTGTTGNYYGLISPFLGSYASANDLYDSAVNSGTTAGTNSYLTEKVMCSVTTAGASGAVKCDNVYPRISEWNGGTSVNFDTNGVKSTSSLNLSGSPTFVFGPPTNWIGANDISKLSSPATPTIAAVSGGNIAASTQVNVQVTYVNAQGQTIGQTASNVTTSGTCTASGNCSVQVTSPAAAASGCAAATGYNIYAANGASPGTYYLQNTGGAISIGTSFTFGTAGNPEQTSGTALPGSSTAYATCQQLISVSGWYAQ